MNLSDLSLFHFIRPYWLLMILPAALMALLLFIREKNNNAWRQHIDPILLTPLLQGMENQPGKKLPTIGMIFWIISALALAGQTWEKLPTPIEKRDTALIIVLDLSPSMLASDVKPSRIIVARHKIIDLLKSRKEGYTALIAYSGDAHIVSPLTDDTQTITNLLNALEPGLMPVYGSNLEDALTKAIALFKSAGYTDGDILLVTDGVTDQAIKKSVPILSGNNFILSIIGVGTGEGAPIPDNSGGFVKDNKGTVILPQLNEKKLVSFARQVDGYYTPLHLDDSDIKPLVEGTKFFNQDPHKALKNKKKQRDFDQWRDVGGILCVLLLPLLLMGFRRGILICVVLIAPLLTTTKLYAEPPQPLPASTAVPVTMWDHLWLNANQRAMKAMKDKNYAAAAKQFDDPDWKAAAQYESGEYSLALKQFQSHSTSEGLYNQANALAKSGQLEHAIAAYNAALKINPRFDDASFNKKLVEELLNQKKQKNSPSSDNTENEQSGEKSQAAQNDKSHNGDGSGDQYENKNTGQQTEPESTSGTPNRDEEQKAHEEKNESLSEAEAKMEAADSGKRLQDKLAEDRFSPELSPEQKQALEQWLRQVPDDPSGLLRNKFEYYYQQRLDEQKSGKSDSHLTDEERW